MKKQPHPDWIEDCERWHGRVLTGRYCHWCWDWDGLPIDETCREWPCACASRKHRIIAWVLNLFRPAAEKWHV